MMSGIAGGTQYSVKVGDGILTKRASGHPDPYIKSFIMHPQVSGISLLKVSSSGSSVDITRTLPYNARNSFYPISEDSS
jgi:hypothetical protein